MKSNEKEKEKDTIAKRAKQRGRERRVGSHRIARLSLSFQTIPMYRIFIHRHYYFVTASPSHPDSNIHKRANMFTRENVLQ